MSKKDMLNLMAEKIKKDLDKIAPSYNERAYELGLHNPNNFSKWFVALKEVQGVTDSVLKLPDTVNFTLPLEVYLQLRVDRPTPESVATIDKYIRDNMVSLGFDYDEFFMKDGTFSNKFNFTDCHLNKSSNIGDAFMNIHYTSSMFGAGSSPEVVLREYIKPREGVKTIYEGMPLRTEFRLFYDFDNREPLGVANYWHPDIMLNNLHDENDLKAYSASMEDLVLEYENNKSFVIEQAVLFLQNVKLEGKWSVDIMKNGDDYYLIDMALMKDSALVSQMTPVVDEAKKEEIFYSELVIEGAFVSNDYVQFFISAERENYVGEKLEPFKNVLVNMDELLAKIVKASSVTYINNAEHDLERLLKEHLPHFYKVVPAFFVQGDKKLTHSVERYGTVIFNGELNYTPSQLMELFENKESAIEYVKTLEGYYVVEDDLEVPF